MIWNSLPRRTVADDWKYQKNVEKVQQPHRQFELLIAILLNRSALEKNLSCYVNFRKEMSIQLAVL